MSGFLSEGIELLIGGSWAPLDKALTDSDKAVETWATKTTAASRRAGRQSVDAAEEAAKRRVAIYERETGELEGELAKRKAAAEASAKQVAEAERRSAQGVTGMVSEELRKRAAAEQAAAEATQRQLTAIQRKGAAAREALTKAEAERRVKIEADTLAAGKQALAQGFAAVGLAAASAALGASMGSMLRAFSEFQGVLNEVNAVAGATTREMELMTAMALELGAATKFNAKEAAQGLSELSKAGFTAQQAMEALPGVLALAAAGGVDVATAAETAANAINGFGLAAEEAGRVADVMAKAANLSAIGVTDLQLTFKYVAPLASAASQSIEDMATAIAIMGNAGIKGEQAGTTLRAMLSRMIDPPKDAAEAFAKLNLHLVDTKGRMLALPQILDELRRKTDGMTQVQRNQTIAAIAGQEALSGTLALLNQSEVSYGKTTKAMHDNADAAKDMAAIMNQGLGPAVEQMQGSVETLAILLGQELAPAAKGVADTVGNAADSFSKWDPSMKRMAVAAAAAGFAFTGLAAALSAMAIPVALVGAGLAALGITTVGPVILGIAAAVGVLSLAVGAYVAIAQDARDVDSQRAREMVAQDKEIRELAARYDELAAKTKRTASEEAEREAILKRLRQIGPDLVRMSEDGKKALDVERKAIEAQNKAREEQIRLMREANFQRAQEALAASHAAQDQLPAMQARLRFARATGDTSTAAAMTAEIDRLMAESKAQYERAQGILRSGYVQPAQGTRPQAPRAAGAGYGETNQGGGGGGRGSQRHGDASSYNVLFGGRAHLGLGDGVGVNRGDHTHGGRDIKQAAGVPIFNPRAGKVLTVAYQAGGAGRYVILQHDDGTVSKFFHLSEQSVKQGQYLNAGDMIGRVGSTGRSSGPHLHFETMRNGVRLSDQAQMDWLEAQRGGGDSAAFNWQRRQDEEARRAAEAEAAEDERRRREKEDYANRFTDRRRDKPRGHVGLRELDEQRFYDPQLRKANSGTPMEIQRDASGVEVLTAEQIERQKALASAAGDTADAMGQATQGYTKQVQAIDQVNKEAQAGMTLLLGAVSEWASDPSWANLGQVVGRISSPQNFSALQAAFSGMGKAYSHARTEVVRFKEEGSDVWHTGVTEIQGFEGVLAGLGGVFGKLGLQLDPVSVGLTAITTLGPVLMDAFDEAINGPKGVRLAFAAWDAQIEAVQEQLGAGLITPLQALQAEANAAREAVAALWEEYKKMGGKEGQDADQRWLDYYQAELAKGAAGAFPAEFLRSQIAAVQARMGKRTSVKEDAIGAQRTASDTEQRARVKANEVANQNRWAIVATQIEEAEDMLAAEAKIQGWDAAKVSKERLGIFQKAYDDLKGAIKALGGPMAQLNTENMALFKFLGQAIAASGEVVDNVDEATKKLSDAEVKARKRLDDLAKMKPADRIKAVMDWDKPNSTDDPMGDAEAYMAQIDKLTPRERILAMLKGDERDAALALLDAEEKREGSLARRIKAEERLAALTALQEKQMEVGASLADASQRRLEAEREITALLRNQADEAERIAGESIAVRQLTEAQDKAKRLAELEQRTADQLERLKVDYTSARDQEIAALNQQAAVQASLQGMKGDAGSSAYDTINAALQAAIAAIFATAPRFHSGGQVPGSGEVPAVLQGGEWVFTPQQLQRLAQTVTSGGALDMPNSVAAVAAAAPGASPSMGSIHVSITTGVIAQPAEFDRLLWNTLDQGLARRGFTMRR